MKKALIIVGLAAAGYLGYTWYRKQQEVAGEIDEAIVVDPTDEPIKPIATVWPLTFGSRGAEVKALQQALIKRGGAIAQYINSTGGADGIWGSGTQKAIIEAGFANIGGPIQISQTLWQRITTGAIKLFGLKGLLS